MFGKQKVAMIVAEFLGSAVLASVVLALLERTSLPYFVALAAGVTYATWWLITGAFINPAITLALWTVRKLQTTHAVVIIAAQALGGLVAWRLNEYLQNGALAKVAGKNIDVRIMVAEGLGTMILSFGVAAALYKQVEDSKRYLSVLGAAVMGTFVASFAAMGLLNPAVAIGVRALSVSYILAPVIGAVLGMNIYAWLFAPVGVLATKSTVAAKPVVKPVPAVAAKTSARRASTKKPVAKRSTAARRGSRR